MPDDLVAMLWGALWGLAIALAGVFLVVVLRERRASTAARA